MCAKLEVSRSGFYAWVKRAPSARVLRDAVLARRIEEHFEQSSGTYGSPRIHALLKRQGHRTGRKRVARLMRQCHLKARASRIYRRLPGNVACKLGIANQAREREVSGPNQVWRGDITYLKAGGSWRYLAVIIDQYSRRLVGWKMGPQRTSELTIAALRRAVQRRRPSAGVIFHSDRGTEYAGYAFRDRLARQGIVQSMNRPGTMADNAFIESFFHSMKSDVIHGHPHPKPAQLEDIVRRYISRYNRTRIHSSLGYRSPIDYERANA
jgi:transposase InsO family protein